jgi:hypothetical protein
MIAQSAQQCLLYIHTKPEIWCGANICNARARSHTKGKLLTSVSVLKVVEQSIVGAKYFPVKWGCVCQGLVGF